MSFTNFNDIAKSKNQMVKIHHVATGNKVEFPGFVTRFEDNYSVSWGSENIFGRNDPVKPYQGTSRTINIAFTVLSPDMNSAQQNMEKFSLLTKMVYPAYSAPLDGSGGSVGRTIKAPPLLRLSFVNFIQSADGMGQLLGCIEGVNFTPDFEPGFFVAQSGEIFPKEFTIDFRFNPQHESPLGWEIGATNSFITDTFPYNSKKPIAGTVSAESSEGNSSLESANNDRTLG